MTSPARLGAVDSAQQGGEAVARRPEFVWLARAGLIARGVSYGIIGVLALKLAVGSAGKATDQQGALKKIAQQADGQALLVFMALGLAAYAIWRLVRAGIGHGTREKDSTGQRVAGLASGVAYAALCVAAVKILVGASTSGGANSPARTTAGVLAWTGGTLIVEITGAVLIGVGLYQGYNAISKRFLQDSKTDMMSRETKRAFTAVGVFGYLGRMVVFGLVGYGLLEAGLNYDPHRAIGLDGALNKLSHYSQGPLMLGVVALGLIGFALYSIADARYRRI